MPSNSRRAPPQNQVTSVVTRSGCRTTPALLTTATLCELQQLCLYTTTALLGMTHHMEILVYAEYTYAATNVQLQHSEGEKVLVTPNTLEVAMSLPETARRKASWDKEIENIRAPKPYDLGPITFVVPGQKVISSFWVYESRRTSRLRGVRSCRLERK